jgi:hypothetical protein
MRPFDRLASPFIASGLAFIIGMVLCHRPWLGVLAVSSYLVIVGSEALILIWLLWPTENASVFGGVSGASATTYRRAEDVRIVPVVVPKFEFCDVQRQVLAADLVEAPHDAALQQRPEAIDGLRVNDAIDVLLFRMPWGISC